MSVEFGRPQNSAAPEVKRSVHASAGHPPPAMAVPDGAARFVETSPNVPLGVLPDSSYVEQELTLGDGHIFLLYTDGLVEMRRKSLDVGFDRLLDVMRGASTPQQVCHQIVRTLVPREGARDDIAFVALQSAPV